MEAEGRNRSAWRRLAMMARIVVEGLKVMVGSGVGGYVTRVEWEARVAVCEGCILFDPVLKRCGPPESPKLGCRCFRDYLCLVRKPFARGCWGREFLPGRGVGWE